ncbi:MAG: tetratricopeptide repeat protein [Sediminibacterium sp.]|jgi:tetratricopeptide (TPR) repeat protein
MSDLQQEQTSTENFFKKNQKSLTYALVAAIVLIGGFFGYTELYQKPREAKAADAMFMAEKYFANDSSNFVLNGDGQSKGVLYIIKEFSGTKAANLAKYYAGVSYFRMNDFNKSIEYLKDFSTDAKQIQAVAYGTLGDAYASLNKVDEAVSHYKKAGEYFPEDEAISSEYLFRAAAYLELNNKTDEAIELYTKIKNEYPKSEKGFMADKYINRLKIQP